MGRTSSIWCSPRDLNKLIVNEAISSYLLRHYPELLDEFRSIVELEALEV